MNPGTRHRLELLGAAVLFSTGGAAVKATTLSAWQVASFRSGVAALVVFLLARQARRGWTWHALPVGATYAATMVLFVTANKLTTSASAIFLQATAPVYVLLLGPLVLKEKVTRRDLWMLLAVGIGLVCFFVGADPPARTAPDPARGNVLAALSGVCWAVTVVALRWMGGRDDDASALPTVVSGNLIAFLACLPMALPVAGTPADWAVVVCLGVFQIGVAYLLLSSGVRGVPALEASTLLLLEPALNPLWSWLVHGETPGALALAGGALILGATTIKTWVDGRGAKRPMPPPD